MRARLPFRRRRPEEHPPLRKRGERTQPSIDNDTKTWKDVTRRLRKLDDAGDEGGGSDSGWSDGGGGGGCGGGGN